MITPLAIPDVLLIQPKRHGDARGWFSETFNAARLEELGLPRFIQDNESLSASAGTIRGLHYQRAPFAQAKLVRCVRGALFDVVLDIRKGSPTFGGHVATRLSAESADQIFVPEGFAHGFCTLEPGTLVQYKVSAPYAPEQEGGVAWDDPTLGIIWPASAADVILSNRDRAHPPLARAKL